MDDFDSEPEDGWHPDDPLPDLLDNVRRRILLLVAASRAGDWTRGEERRARDLDEDVRFLIERVRTGG